MQCYVLSSKVDAGVSVLQQNCNNQFNISNFAFCSNLYISKDEMNYERVLREAF